jgi:hypothetical protein
MTVVGERLIYELRGIACIKLETMPAAKRLGCASATAQDPCRRAP